jgi:hypothetical protein
VKNRQARQIYRHFTGMQEENRKLPAHGKWFDTQSSANGIVFI